jgi:hypothetical protein
MFANPDALVAVVSGMATLIAALLSSLAKRRVTTTIEDFIKPSRSKEKFPHEDGLSIRFREVREEFQRQKRVAMVNHLASSILTFGQFIIGGLLATSFLQENLSKSVIGVIGLLVLTSSLVRQYYHPDIQAAAATGRAAKLKAMIRKAQDQLYLLDEKVADALPRHKILEMLSNGLAEIEESEASDLQSSAQQIPSQSKSGEKRSIDSKRAT